MSLRFLPILLAGALGACATGGYQYEPEVATSSVEGLPAARYAIPPAGPTGHVEVASPGIADLRGSGNVLPTIHVRMVADNRSDAQPWHIDVSAARLKIAGRFQSQPMFVNRDLNGPTVTVNPYERRVVDFYFPLPRSYTNEGFLPDFDFVWAVEVPGQTIRGRTHFTRTPA
jgi:hypothetical protein